MDSGRRGEMDSEMKMKKAAVCLVLFAGIIVSGCDTGKKGEGTFSFNYNTILNREFRNNIGRIIPVAYEKAIETDGDMSSDGNFLYYTSNRDNGNFDIYLRDLSDITTVRITEHAAKDTQPVISPDGEHLAYVSNREDPEGDIYVVEIDPQKLASGARKSIAGLPTLDEKAVTSHS